MKKQTFALLAMMVFSVFLYAGEDKGMFACGIQARLGNEDGIFIDNDIRTYISAATYDGFKPSNVLYKFGIGTKAIRVYHECYHNVDGPASTVPNRNYFEVSL
jgi:hypothetical protein